RVVRCTGGRPAVAAHVATQHPEPPREPRDPVAPVLAVAPEARLDQHDLRFDPRLTEVVVVVRALEVAGPHARHRPTDQAGTRARNLNSPGRSTTSTSVKPASVRRFASVEGSTGLYVSSM